MSFESDLATIIKQQFDQAGICYDSGLNVCSLAARYLEMVNRRIVPTPRSVHFSQEIHDSLGDLKRKVDPDQKKKADEAWTAVFLIRYLLTEGKNVNGFLHKGINYAKGKRSRDGLLWDYGMHHFHLSKESESSGFVKRSDYLLFAVVTQEDAYFVDVRRHPDPNDPNDVGWVEQDLLKIVHSNWPNLIGSNILRGVKGDVLTDKEKKELRRKNVNHIAAIDGNAIAPLGGGTAFDGSSIRCRWFAMQLLHEVKRHQLFFDSHPKDLRSALGGNGVKIAGKMEFELVLLDDLNLSDELMDLLRKDQCLSRDLCQMGFAIVEATTRLPIAVSLEEQP